MKGITQTDKVLRCTNQHLMTIAEGSFGALREEASGSCRCVWKRETLLQCEAIFALQHKHEELRHRGLVAGLTVDSVGNPASMR